MAKIKDDGVRRVYVLPSDLVERIARFQTKRGYASEVETVRRLIDTGLNLSDDESDIVSRILGKLKIGNDLNDAARDVLVGHPLVTDIGFHKGQLQFWLRDRDTFKIDRSGKVEHADPTLMNWTVWSR